jgi:hypothetical protein
MSFSELLAEVEAKKERGDVEHRGSRSLNHRIIAVPQIRLSSSYGRCCLATGLPRCASSALSQLALEDCG